MKLNILSSATKDTNIMIRIRKFYWDSQTKSFLPLQILQRNILIYLTKLPTDL